jgi:hypothetical protein
LFGVYCSLFDGGQGRLSQAVYSFFFLCDLRIGIFVGVWFVVFGIGLV